MRCPATPHAAIECAPGAAALTSPIAGDTQDVQVSRTERYGQFAISVVKNVEGHRNLLKVMTRAAGFWFVTLLGMFIFGGGPGEPDGAGEGVSARYLIWLSDTDTGETRTVRRAMTRWGARASAAELRKILKAGDVDVIRSIIGAGS